MEICKPEICTGCAACVEICPKHCINMQPDQLSSLHPLINEDLCISCGLCEKTCPNNSIPSFHQAKNVFAAWSNNEEQRLTSASGGIASELYKFILNKGGVGTGVILDERGCHYILVENEQDIRRAKNSKYVFSDTDGIYKKVKERLIKGQQVLFVGLPCQVAGLMAYLHGRTDGLFTVDIICHGLAPYEYFKQHVRNIEKKYNEHVNSTSFRNPIFNTYTYTFTFTNEQNEIFYSKKGDSFDAWQLGYHRGLIYRENCYQCRYAQSNRVGDLTIGDFSGLGREAQLEYSWQNVSCVICNTDKGFYLINQTREAISYNQRPIQEAFNYEHQLQHPFAKHKRRSNFENVYIRTKSFKKATDIGLIGDRFDNFVIKCKSFVTRWIIRLPYRTYKYIKKKL